jgi:hypothetical protein
MMGWFAQQQLHDHKQAVRSTAEHAWKANPANMKSMHADAVLIEHIHGEETVLRSQRLQQSAWLPKSVAIAPDDCSERKRQQGPT